VLRLGVISLSHISHGSNMVIVNNFSSDLADLQLAFVDNTPLTTTGNEPPSSTFQGPPANTQLSQNHCECIATLFAVGEVQSRLLKLGLASCQSNLHSAETFSGAQGYHVTRGQEWQFEGSTSVGTNGTLVIHCKTNNVEKRLGYQ